MHFLFLPLLTILTATASAETMSWLENADLKLGIDLERGGAITFLATQPNGTNVINNFDLGRQVQLSFFSGPVPFEADGQKPSAHWQHIGWNPIQSGDDFDNRSRVLRHENDGRQLHVVCEPLQWPLNRVPGDCTFDVWLELEGPVVKARARLTNQRRDRTLYPARLQELPAVYANAAFPRVVSYQGTQPFTGAATERVPAATGSHPWSFWIGTEGWAALLEAERDWGLGLITPGRVHFTGGFAGQPGPNDTHGNSTGYLAGQGQEILDADIVYEFRYELVLGSLQSIRDRAAQARPSRPPAWTFERDRQGWHYQNATDTGWPIQNHLHVRLEANDPQLISPYTFWQAEHATHLVIEAAFSPCSSTPPAPATVMWQAHGETTFTGKRSLPLPIVADGQFHRHVLRLADHTEYRGSLTRLRFDPVGHGKPGAWMQLRRVQLTSSPAP